MNEVERLFQEQQAASDGERNPETDEPVNEAETLFREQQAAFDAEHDPETDEAVNEVEALFREQQTASDGERNPEADETVNEAEALSPEQQAASERKHNLEKDIRSVQTMLNIGIILKAAQTALEIGIYRFPLPVLKLMSSVPELEKAAETLKTPLLLLPALVSFGIVLLFYNLLKKQNRQTTDACIPLFVLTLIIPLISSVIGTVINPLTMVWFSRVHNSKALTVLGTVRSAVSMSSLIAAPVIPLFSASAGIIWHRYQQPKD